MKSAKDYLQHWRSGLTEYLTTDVEERYNKERPDLEELFKQYAREAIKADRINVAEHANTIAPYLVNKKSIINAPDITLP